MTNRQRYWAELIGVTLTLAAILAICFFV